jgi:type I restriction enzyme R subunit
MTTPEQKAREEIDRQLEAAGWLVQDMARLNIGAGDGIAVREFKLQAGAADYLLYLDQRAVGVVEAKPVGHTLTGVELQSSKYTTGLPVGLPTWRRPLPFAYESTGAVTQFTSVIDPEPRSREVFTFHRPEELRRILELDAPLRARLRQMPDLDTTRLWSAQIEAIRNLELSLAQDKPRALIQMATGSGKTFTAASFCYRLIKFAGAKRILFLVDRNNLGKQTLTEFQQYLSPYTNRGFTEEYVVQRAARNAIDPAAKVVITTIQRLYSMLKGEVDYDEGNEESSSFERAPSPLQREPLPVVYSATLPIEHFDIIVIDECHRSIYNIWRQVLEYFDAHLIGLTATPSAQTLGFFKGNLVQDYSHERAVADRVNVGCDVYRIRTEVSQSGATVLKEAGKLVPRRDRRTLKQRLAELDDDKSYAATQLNLDVVVPSQIRTVIQTFRDRLFTEIFPGRTDVPKTLVFCKTDLHADDVVKVIREEFAKGNEFCVKITSQTTGRRPEDLLQEFRNNYFPRIAVTVDMIATGTDVKPLECLLFLRSVESAAYFEQMKGRGVRVLSPDALRTVTPDAPAKTHFVIVDAVGVCEREQHTTTSLNRKPSVGLAKLLDMVGKGMVHVDIVSTLADRLARLSARLTPDQARLIDDAARQPLPTLIGSLLQSIDADHIAERARRQYGLGADVEPTEPQMDAAENASMREALAPFLDPDLRRAILDVVETLEQVIAEDVQDRLLEGTGFSAADREKARGTMADLRAFCVEHKDDIEALSLLYSKPYRSGLRYRQVRELAQKLAVAPFHIDPALPATVQRLWRAQDEAEPGTVKGQARSLIDLIALVRHALHPEAPVIPVAEEIQHRYADWLGEQYGRGVTFTYEQREWLDMIRDHIATSLAIERESFEDAPFAQKGGLGKVYALFGEKLEPLLAELNERLAA